MSRLDQHVRLVQNKMTLGRLLRAWAWAGIGFCAVVAVAILVRRVIFGQENFPHRGIWFWSGAGVALVAGAVFALLRRPTAQQAAVAIDEQLALKEKFSTALFVRASKDPFAAAAVRDAEKTAENVSLRRRFPVQYPRAGWGTLGVALCAALVAWLMPTFDLFGVKAMQQAKAEQQRAEVARVETQLKKAMVAIQAAPEEVQADEQIKLAAKELPDLLHHATADPIRAAKRAEETLKQIDAIKQKIKDEKNFAEAKHEFDNLKNVTPPSPSETGPIADAHRALSQGKLDEAVNDLKQAVDNFDKMDKQQQDKAAEQMQKLAQQIQQQANNPQVQQQIQQQLQQAGMSQQQAKQMQHLMQQAANGNQQASQQLQQMANQAIQQANQQAGLSQQQQQQIAQQIQKAVQQGQQQSNSQANAQAMQKAAQSLAQAMQQAAKSGQQQQQAGANKQQGQAGGGNQMAQAAQAMRQQLQQLQAQANGGAGIAAGQQGGQAGQNGRGGGGNNQQMANGQWGNGNGQQGLGQPQPGQQGGQGGPGIAAMGKRPDPTETPFGVKTELSQSQTEEKGKILASSFVKAPAEKGESKMTLTKVAEAEMKEATDEVQQERIPRSAQRAVKGYFDALKKDNQQGK